MGRRRLFAEAYIRAITVYEKASFAVTGRIPKKFFKNSEYIDELIMAKVLE